MGGCNGKGTSKEFDNVGLPNGKDDAGGNRFATKYRIGEKLGAGTFSEVKLVTVKAGEDQGSQYACKIIKKGGLTVEDKAALKIEIEILLEMNHPNIMRLVEVMEDSKHHYLVTELLDGGELFDRIVEKALYSEREARDVVKILLEVMVYCHERNVVHRDLKPENLLLTSKNNDSNIKIADFGFAKKVGVVEDLSTACGTPGYVAPEILNGKAYGKGVDIWSIGVITYILLCGYPPFHHDNQPRLFQMIKAGEYEFDEQYWDEVSEEAKDLIRRMLTVDSKQRATAQELLQHPWVVGDEVSDAPLTSAVTELKKMLAKRKFKSAVDAVMTVNRMRILMGPMKAAAAAAE